MADKEWLESLQVGDSVAIRSGGWGRTNYKIVKIDRITPTRQFVIGNRRFDNNGNEKGKKDSWSYRESMEPITEQIKESLEREKLVWFIDKYKMKELPIEKLRAIANILNGKAAGPDEKS